MAKIKFNPFLDEVTGKVRGLVVKRYKGRPYLAALPDLSRRVLTPKQKEHLNKFKYASQYAKEALKVPDIRRMYAAKAAAVGKPTSGLAIGDFMNAPVIRDIDLSGYFRRAGDVIRIEAEDDFEVTRVKVTIRKSDGEVVEDGAATNDTPWRYVARTDLADAGALALEVVAMDRPGNRTFGVEAL